MAAIQRKREGLPVLQPLPSKQEPKCNGCAGDRGCCASKGVSEEKSHLVDALFSSAVAPESNAPVSFSKEQTALAPASTHVSALVPARIVEASHVELHMPPTHSISMSLASFNARADVFVPPAPALVAELLSVGQGIRLDLVASELAGASLDGSLTKESSHEQPVFATHKAAEPILPARIHFIRSSFMSAPFFAFTRGYAPDRSVDVVTSLPQLVPLIAAHAASFAQEGVSDTSSPLPGGVVLPLQTARTPAYRSFATALVPSTFSPVRSSAQQPVRMFSSTYVRKSPCVTNLLFSQIRVARFASPFESSTCTAGISSRFAKPPRARARDFSSRNQAGKEKIRLPKPISQKIQGRVGAPSTSSKEKVLSTPSSASAQVTEKTPKRQKTARAKEAAVHKSIHQATQAPMAVKHVVAQKSFTVSSFPPFVRNHLTAQMGRKKRISLVELEYLINSTKTKKQVRFIAALKAALLKLLSSYRH